MASLKIKYAAIIISSLIAGGLISVTAWQYVNSAQKTEKTEQKKKKMANVQIVPNARVSGETGTCAAPGDRVRERWWG